MKCRVTLETQGIINENMGPRDNSALARVLHSVSGEVTRQIDALRLDIRDNMILGRMNMLADFKVMGNPNRLAEPLRYALVWSLIHKMDTFAVSLSGLSGVNPVKTGSSKLDAIPASLANYALIYRTYKNFRKGELAKVRDLESLERIVSKQKATETIYIAAELGIIHTLDLRSLISMESLQIYKSMLLAEGCEVVYYSLDTSSEDQNSDIVSHARARAVGRALDVVISKMFSVRATNPETDLERLTMMTIRGSVRGSVHRKEPFNRRVIRNWLTNLFNMGYTLYYSLPNYLRRSRRSYDDRDEDWRDIPKNAIDDHYEQAVALTCQMSKLGDISQYDQAAKYIKNLVRWGYLEILFNYFHEMKDRISEYIDMVICTSVRPILSFVRTVSYSMAENVLSSLPPGIEYNTDEIDPLGEEISSLMSHYKSMNIRDHKSLVNCEPCDQYRHGLGTLTDFTIKLQSPYLSESHVITLLAYSLALPLLISSGVSSFKRIVDFSLTSENVDRAKVEKVIKDYSIPIDEGESSLPIYVFRGMSESNLLESLDRWLRSLQETALLVVEIPPTSSPCSLGIIANITSHQLSYITTSVSSDLLGFSVYVSAVVRNYRMPRERLSNQPQLKTTSLGDIAMVSLLNLLTNKDPTYLSKVILTPLHQAGLPVNAKVWFRGEPVFSEIEEELVDRLTVSFIETGKPSASLMQLAKIPEERVVYLSKALLAKRLNKPPEVRAVVSSSYYYHSIYPHLPAQDFANLFCKVLSDEYSEKHIENTFRYILDPLAVLQGVHVSDLPIGVQYHERNVPNITMRRHYVDSDISRKLQDFLTVTGESILPEPMDNPLLEIFRNAKELNLNVLDIMMEATKPKRSTRKWVEEEEEISTHDYLLLGQPGENQYLTELRNQVMDKMEWDPGQVLRSTLIPRESIQGLVSEVVHRDPGKGKVTNDEGDDPGDPRVQRVYEVLFESGMDTQDFDRIMEFNPEVAQTIMDLPADEMIEAIEDYFIKTSICVAPKVGVSSSSQLYKK